MKSEYLFLAAVHSVTDFLPPWKKLMIMAYLIVSLEAEDVPWVFELVAATSCAAHQIAGAFG